MLVLGEQEFELKLCFNCLRAKHTASNCRNEGRYKNCKGKHHTSICNSNNSNSNQVSNGGNSNGANSHAHNSNFSGYSGSNSLSMSSGNQSLSNANHSAENSYGGAIHNGEPEGSNSIHNVETITLNAGSGDSNTVNILPTAILSLLVNNSVTSVRCILDSGSQRSFILRSIVDKLKLPIVDKITFAIDGFNSLGKMQTYDVVNFDVTTTDGLLQFLLWL